MPNLLANLKQRNKANATDLIFCDTPAYLNGAKAEHVFVGKDSKFLDIYPANDQTQDTFAGRLQDQVHTQGAPIKLIADNTSVFIVSKIRYNI